MLSFADGDAQHPHVQRFAVHPGEAASDEGGTETDVSTVSDGVSVQSDPSLSEGDDSDDSRHSGDSPVPISDLSISPACSYGEDSD